MGGYVLLAVLMFLVFGVPADRLGLPTPLAP